MITDVLVIGVCFCLGLRCLFCFGIVVCLRCFLVCCVNSVDCTVMLYCGYCLLLVFVTWCCFWVCLLNYGFVLLFSVDLFSVYWLVCLVWLRVVCLFVIGLIVVGCCLVWLFCWVWV